MPATARKGSPSTAIFKARGGKLGRDALQCCAEAIKAGGVIVFPTDTVYGIACNAFNVAAIHRIYELKGRNYSKPLPLLLEDAAKLPLVAKDVLPQADVLIDAYWPGPLTLVLKTAPMAVNAARGKASVAVRVPDHGVVRSILKAAHVPLATTSANKSGEDAISEGEEAIELFEGLVDVIIDGGTCPVGTASTVVDATHFPFTVLREGSISRFELTKRLNLG
jgi:L-threonylcarbamoyladenylate synthase